MNANDLNDLMVWDYADDIAPWDYDGGREDFAKFVKVTGWSKPVQENISEFEAAFAEWFKNEYQEA